jgi:hypothetical protein
MLGSDTGSAVEGSAGARSHRQGPARAALFLALGSSEHCRPGPTHATSAKGRRRSSASRPNSDLQADRQKADAPNGSDGWRLCVNALVWVFDEVSRRGVFRRAIGRDICGIDERPSQARIAAISGWTPRMAIIRFRL